jgi:hypothetical protein
LSGIGHIAKMPQILYWAQLCFGPGGTITCHEHGSSPVHDHGGFLESETGTALCLFSRLQLYPKQSEEKRLLDAMLLAVPR